ncbi:MAG: IS21 family transposase [Elusimicrobia bacterium]|nr:IS21 family transposase [Elusimicrobiota bacterium]
MLKVEDYEVIRRKVMAEGWSVRRAARELGHSRKTVRKALEYPSPPGYRRSGEPARPAVGPFRDVILGYLEADRGAPRKQRHTAQRVFERLVAEHGYAGSASAVRRYIGTLKPRREVFVPLVFGPGEEGQVDFGEALAVLNGVERVAVLFCMRLCHSRAWFVKAYERGSLESFLDGHVSAFGFFGGVPRRLAYDNLKCAVVRVGRGRERKLNAKFLELRSHYLFESRFCNPARGNEKGHVENSVKEAQRSLMTPVPCAASLEELNEKLAAACQRDLHKMVARLGKPRGGLLEEERGGMLPLPRAPFRACVGAPAVATKQALVRFDGNDYSVPRDHAYRPCHVRGFVERVEILHGAEVIATHRRSTGKGEYVLDPFHYLPVLERKPGALLNGRPFKGEPFGEAFSRLRRELLHRLGPEGDRHFVRVLLLMTKHPGEEVKRAVEDCVARRAFSADAVELALRDTPVAARQPLDMALLPLLPEVGSGKRPAGLYDALLKGVSP